MNEIQHTPEREKDVQELCKQVINCNANGNYHDRGDWTTCPLCYKCTEGINTAEMSVIKHELNCAYLIAKDLSIYKK